MNSKNNTRFSYEFFPPRSERMQRRLWRSVGQLERLRPSFFSMTYGALGSAQEVSIENAIAMHRDSPVAVAAHLTCSGATRVQIDDVVRQFYDAGIRRIVALRGDAASSETTSISGYGSVVELIESLVGFGDIDVSVAAYPEVHPEARSASADMRHLRRKLDAGAQRAITQYFFDADCFLRFRDRAQRIGIDKPIIPGILPVHDLDRVRLFSERCGATVPGSYDKLFAAVNNDPEAQYRLALELAVELCERLIREGVDSFHFYTLNQTDMCLDISMALGASLQKPELTTAA
ncbi:MAG: methylenetetrahydrofolate reductase [Gammaproteobacteria bacterium]|nr:methylenetetrahydrofolate reductase [Gammaproteobacteria bacterium]MDH3536165.1 methylenetetrahydrofolate reductase [Gammaproteobacteria bacterium]